jgi:hypothetical protein
VSDDHDRGFGGILQSIGRFEDAPNDGKYPWLGLSPGLALAIVLTVVAVGAAPLLWVVAFYSDSRLLTKGVGLAWICLAAFAMAYWRRQRLAAHFEAAHRRLASANPDEREGALVDLMINARRGRAEHGRIARDLAGYLRRPPIGDPGEPARRQIAFSMLADQTLDMAAKERLDLSGAMLAGIRGGSAELPGVHLHGADLTGAQLGRANLEGADLSGARLEGTNLSGARLAGAILPPSFHGGGGSK